MNHRLPCTVIPIPFLWATLCAACLAGCSFVSPTVTVTPATQPTTNLDGTVGYVTSFESCFPARHKLPTAEALTRQLFVGWTDVILQEPVHLDPWEGFAVTGKLDATKVRAIAITKPGKNPGCVEELVTFSPEHEASSSGTQAMISGIRTYLAHRDPMSQDPSEHGRAHFAVQPSLASRDTEHTP